MNCHSTRAVLDLHAEGRLSDRRARSVSAHLASCAACAALSSPAAAPAARPGADFKARLAASLKAGRAARESAAPRPALELWPRDFSGIALAAAALALVAVIIGWGGAPPQRDLGGDELAGRMP